MDSITVLVIIVASISAVVAYAVTALYYEMQPVKIPDAHLEDVPDTPYDFCPRPGCTMAAQHRAANNR